MKTLCILLAIILPGCAACDLPNEVKVPVAVSCITVAPTAPKITTAEEFIAMAEKCKAGDEHSCYAAVTTIHSDRLNLQAYRLQAEVVMEGCVVR